jgi:apolipoprotein N-acyltransferase
MIKKWLETVGQTAAKLARFAWEQFKRFWFNIAVPWLKEPLTLRRAVKLLGIAFVFGVLFVAFLFFIFSFGLPTVESLKDYKPSSWRPKTRVSTSTRASITAAF